jgi:hypothetical protein
MAGEFDYLRAEIELLAVDASNAIQQADLLKDNLQYACGYWSGIKTQAQIQQRYAKDLLFIVDAMQELGIGEPGIAIIVVP